MDSRSAPARRGAIVALLGLSLALAVAGGPRRPSDPEPAEQVQDRSEQIRALIKGGRYAEAEVLANEALREIEAAGSPDPLEAGRILDLLIEALWPNRRSRHADLVAHAERVVLIKESLFGPGDLRVAGGLNRLALLREDAGDHAGARALHERELKIREKEQGADHPEVAKCLSNLANLLSETGDYVGARTLHERALAVREKAFGPEHHLVARSLNHVANAWADTGEFAEARRLYERALVIHEKSLGPDHPDVAMTLNNLALLLKHTGDLAAARPLHERALVIEEKHLGPENLQIALSLNNLGNLLVDLGEYAQARQVHLRALGIREKHLRPDHPEVAISLNNLGILFSTMGDYAQARPMFERAAAIHEQALGEHPALASTLNNLGTLLEKVENYEDARRLFERALAIKEKVLGPEHPALASSLDNLGGLLKETGDRAGARRLLERSVAVTERSKPGHPDLADGLVSLAELLADMGDLREAVRDLERAVVIYEEELGPGHPQLAMALASLANVRARRGEVRGTLSAALRAEQIGREHLSLTARTLPERQALRYASVRGRGLDLVLSLAIPAGDAASRRTAVESLVRSRALVLDEMAGRRRSVLLAGKEHLGDLAERLAAARTRLANLAVRGAGRLPSEAYRRLMEQARLEGERAEQELAERSASFRDDLTRTRLGLADIEKALPPRTALIAYATYGHSEPGGTPSTLAGGRLPPPPDPPGPLPAEPPGRRSSSIEDEAPGTKRTPSDSVPGPDAPQTSSEAVLSCLAVVLRAGDTDPALVPLGPIEPIEALIRQWSTRAASAPEGSRPARRRAEQDYRRAGEALRRAVWDPLARHLEGSRQIFIVPDGALHLVNFSTLPTGDDRYILETGPVLHYLSAERDLVRPERPSGPAGGLLVLGGADFDAAGGPPASTAELALHPPEAGPRLAAMEAAGPAPPGSSMPGSGTNSKEPQPVYRGPRSSCADFASMKFPPLPASRKEADEIASLWRRHAPDSSAGGAVLKLTGARAAEEAFKRLAPGRKILHLATHGFFLDERCPSALGTRPGGEPRAGGEPPPPLIGENPLLLSGLVLAGANRREAPGSSADAEDGILTAEEIASLDLSGVEWAVLSACETGLGEVQAGEGVLGLRRAFQVAGAGTLIMSLWRVDDEAAREWMRRLYEGRLSGLSTAEAVREAGLGMLEARRRAGRDTHPFTWGAFVAAGDWR